ncbi:MULTISPECIES: hypothetical protein [unclassified Streptomyces]|uniref:hypothetical protein n=1 Tax=unclassified Streptomyces TaxID=2593676 RepID=UPI00115FCE59|nr:MULTISPECIES: hypothetical protein [unclassified Streptomyces]
MACGLCGSGEVAQQESALGEADPVEGVASAGFWAALIERGADLLCRSGRMLVGIGTGKIEESASGHAGEFGGVEVVEPVGLFIGTGGGQRLLRLRARALA